MLGIAAILISALVLYLIVFLAHLLLVPTHLHESILDRWKANADETLAGWQESAKETFESWKTSNEAMLYHILKIALIGQRREATDLRERLAASE